MGAWITAFSYGTSYFSAVIFIGYAGKIGWGFGISSIWIGIMNAVIGSLFAWKVLASRTRRMTHHLQTATMPEFFQARYDSKKMKIVSAILIFVFLLPYCASVYQGLGYLFEMVFNIPFMFAMLAMAVLTGIYLILGGYVATAINDLIQGCIMLVGVILMLFYVFTHPNVGGISEGIHKLSQIPEVGQGLASIFSGNPVGLLGLVVLTSFGVWGLPQMIHKFYTIKDEKAIKTGTIISTVFALVIGGGAYFTGAFGRLFLNNTLPVGANGSVNFDMIMPQVLTTALPEALLGIVVVLVLSASMSTLSSLVLVSSSAIAIDLVQGVMMPTIKKDKVMIIMRLLCVAFIAFSFLIAVTPNAIVALMALSWGTLAGCFLAPYLLGLYWKKTTRIGAWAGMLSGLATVLIAVAINGGIAGISMPNIGSLAMVISMIITLVVSLITPKYSQTFIDNIFNY
jgi:SSS family solute:Na+ symporter/sodium/proline symporter